MKTIIHGSHWPQLENTDSNAKVDSYEITKTVNKYQNSNYVIENCSVWCKGLKWQPLVCFCRKSVYSQQRWVWLQGLGKLGKVRSFVFLESYFGRNLHNFPFSVLKKIVGFCRKSVGSNNHITNFIINFTPKSVLSNEQTDESNFLCTSYSCHHILIKLFHCSNKCHSTFFFPPSNTK